MCMQWRRYLASFGCLRSRPQGCNSEHLRLLFSHLVRHQIVASCNSMKDICKLTFLLLLFLMSKLSPCSLEISLKDTVLQALGHSLVAACAPMPGKAWIFSNCKGVAQSIEDRSTPPVRNLISQISLITKFTMVFQVPYLQKVSQCTIISKVPVGLLRSSVSQGALRRFPRTKR
eukprot:gnl/MRDRNA2_/MRDRNA2_30363_c0_seq1.p1 gnl/MRDRNA2_/MRDRNA2_30363_c0~~gnl/MRDRNA2_/MRDRNA2_30363_c0_seq1.p1  ORF type:complete len:174 (+),score=10.30 gnl/MRDRNA2_/MRDRNA2_30363_c0_seq1:285-806(+)